MALLEGAPPPRGGGYKYKYDQRTSPQEERVAKQTTEGLMMGRVNAVRVYARV